MPRLLRRTLVLGLAAFTAAPALAQEAAAPVVVTEADLEWKEMFPGVSFAAVAGDWTAGKHAKLVRFDPGVRAPMHVHTNAYHGIVVQGTVTNPYAGDAEEVAMDPGTYWHVPGGAVHATACVSEEPCVFYTHGDAAWDIEVTEEAAPAAGDGR